MRIKKPSVCGSLESSDILISLAVNDNNGNKIHLQSTVQNQFGDAIEAVISQVLEENCLEDACVYAIDKGALDCTIRARMETAIARALSEVPELPTVPEVAL